MTAVLCHNLLYSIEPILSSLDSLSFTVQNFKNIRKKFLILKLLLNALFHCIWDGSQGNSYSSDQPHILKALSLMILKITTYSLVDFLKSISLKQFGEEAMHAGRLTGILFQASNWIFNVSLQHQILNVKNQSLGQQTKWLAYDHGPLPFCKICKKWDFGVTI